MSSKLFYYCCTSVQCAFAIHTVIQFIGLFPYALSRLYPYHYCGDIEDECLVCCNVVGIALLVHVEAQGESKVGLVKLEQEK